MSRELTPIELEQLNDFVGFEEGNPKYRVKFAPNLFVYLGGELQYKYPDLDAGGDEIRPKPTYVLEMYKEPGFFGDRKDWDWLNDGPFPENGEYIFRAFLGNEEGGYLEICDAMFEMVMLIVSMDRKFGHMTPDKQKKYIQSYFDKKEARKKQTRQEKLDALNSDSMDRQQRLPINPVSCFPSDLKSVNLDPKKDTKILTAERTAPQTIILPSNKEIKTYAK